jgi:hypothetical protein
MLNDNLYQKLAVRAENSQVLSSAYKCQKGACAIIEALWIDHGMTPQAIIEDVETSFERIYAPLI